MPQNEMAPLWDTMRVCVCVCVCVVCFVFPVGSCEAKCIGLVMMMFILHCDGILASFNAFFFISVLFSLSLAVRVCLRPGGFRCSWELFGVIGLLPVWEK